MNSSFVYSLKVSVLRGAGGKALATDHRGYEFISNTLRLPSWVSVFTWRNGDTGALICLCLIAAVFSPRYQFISNTLLLPPGISVFTWRNGDTGALICLCLIASVFFPRAITSFRIIFCCLLG